MITKLSHVSQILDAKAPSESAALKAWLKGVAQQVADAASEGGVLGFGATKVSDAEKATIAEVGKALNVT